MRRTFVVTFVLSLLAGISPAGACECASPGALCSVYWRTSAIFVGTVRDIQLVPARPRMRAVVFDVDTRGKGVTSDTMVVEAEPQDGFSCGYTFRIGVRYFVRANSNGSGQLMTTMCSGTRPASEAAAEVEFLRDVTGPPRGVRIFGQVYRVEDDLVSPRLASAAVIGARVSVTGSGGSRDAVVTADGNFDFRDLAPGTYTVSATLPAGLTLAGRSLTRPITLTNPSECSEVWLSPRTDSRIAGVLLDAAGRPVEDERVDMIAFANAASTERTVRAVSARTGADGRFEFVFVATGNYLVGIGLTAPPQPTELDRRVYHPGVASAAAAALVRVEGGSRIDLGELRLPEWPSDRHITGVVVSSDGTPAADARLTLVGAGPEDLRLDANGRFDLQLPYGAFFTLRAQLSRLANGRRTLASAERTIGRNDKDADLTITLGVPR